MEVNLQSGVTSKERKIAHTLMILLVINWGFEYSIAKAALEVLEPMQLLFFKYFVGFFVFLTIKIIKKIPWKIEKRDIKIFILCSLTGEILYFFGEYTAMDYLPVSLISIMLTLVPLVSIIIERVVFGVKSNWKINVGIIISIIGIVCIIGVDVAKLSFETMIGYGLCIFAIVAWNAYNFLTSKLRGNYHTVTVGLTQLTVTFLILAPFILRSLPTIHHVTPITVGAVLYLGIFSAGFGFFCYIFAIGKLGPTTNAVYSNFMPVTTTFFGVVLLGELISPIQILGGAICIGAGYIVIKEKGKINLSNGK